MSAGAPVAADLEERFQAELALHGVDLVEVEVLRGGGRLTLRFAIDKEGGVTIEDCAAMNRVITSLIEADLQDLGRYVVEVSSPGLFRRLRRPEHFHRFEGELAQVTILQGDEGKTRQLRGILLRAGENSFVLQPVEGEAEEISYDVVKSAHLDPDLEIGRPKESKTAVKERKAKRSRKGK